jgi:hypothetical protein
MCSAAAKRTIVVRVRPLLLVLLVLVLLVLMVARTHCGRIYRPEAKSTDAFLGLNRETWTTLQRLLTVTDPGVCVCVCVCVWHCTPYQRSAKGTGLLTAYSQSSLSPECSAVTSYNDGVQ